MAAPSQSADDRVLSKLAELAAQHAELSAQLEDPAVAGDHKHATALSIKRAALDPVVSAYREHERLVAEASELRAAIAGDDPELAELSREELPEVEQRAADTLARMKQELVSADDRAIGSVILEIRAGTGGDEAGLWARDLLEVYTRYAARKGWRVDTMELDADPSLGGVRRGVVSITGEGVWHELRFEAGVHSVKRVPATETQGRVHTSTCTVAVLPEPEEVEVSIDWAGDVVEHVTTAQGPGGQNVNKVATAVHLIHRPSGIEVRMQETKSKAQNRQKAWQLLRARLFEHQRREAQAQRDEQRAAMIGTAGRSERVRTYRYKDNLVVDHRLSGVNFNLQAVIGGELGPVVEALIAEDRARRLAAL